MEDTLTFFKILVAVFTITWIGLRIRNLILTRKQEDDDIKKQINLKELEIQAAMRVHPLNREKRFNELGGYIVDRNGPTERFYSYENKVEMDEFDATYREKMDSLYAELRHLRNKIGDTGLVWIGTQPKKTLFQKFKFWRK